MGLRVETGRRRGARAQRGQSGGEIAGAQGREQRGDDGVGVGRSGRGRSALGAHVKQIEGAVAVRTKPEASVLGDLGCAIAEGGNLGVQAPARGFDGLRPRHQHRHAVVLLHCALHRGEGFMSSKISQRAL